jgi:hypothetical protein
LKLQDFYSKLLVSKNEKNNFFELQNTSKIYNDFFKSNLSKNGTISNSQNASLLFELFLDDKIEDENIKKIFESP